MTDILNDFLSLEKLQQGKMVKEESDFVLPEFVNELVDETRSTTRAEQTITYEHEGAEIVKLDQKMIRHILLNLISNAIKYSRPGDPIEVKTRVDKFAVVLTIIDHGIGIPEAEQKNIFKKFFRANNVEGIQGTGLGLNIVKQYVNLMSGNVKFESSPEKGTIFTVIINRK